MNEKIKTSDLPWKGPGKEVLRAGFGRMLRLEWISLGYQIFITCVLAAFASTSQVIKTEWMENALAIVPIAGVLLTYKTENKPPDAHRPFGYHRAATIAFVAASFTLAGIGLYLSYEAVSNLLRGERPSIGGFQFFGQTVWLGWVLIFLMAVSAVPSVILGKMKGPVAILIHDKALHADAEMNRANWLSNGAGCIGLLLVAYGYWWGDSLAALLIALDIARDGITSVMHSLSDVMDHHPTDLENGQQHPVVKEVYRAVGALPFVASHKTLIREHGRYLFAEIFIEPNGEMPPVLDATRAVREAVLPLDWRLQHLAIEFTEDLNDSALVLTRRELEIETQGTPEIERT
ncbi:MAG TPA: cation transporter [Abditibacteriaceae bacterium]|jgi:divalent metal cation (Fe/Co/Zn/Cd) transporter